MRTVVLIALASQCMQTIVLADDCGGDGVGNCCVAAEDGVGGCEDPVCCKIVCDFDSSCCDVQWDEICASQAEDLCGENYCGNCQGTGEIFMVPDPYPNIASGIAAACDGDIVLVAPGVYQEQVVLEGKRIELISEEGPEKTIIDANFEGSCLSVIEVEGPGARISGFTLRNGVGNSSIFWSFGGGIFCYMSDFEAHDCIIEENVIKFGDGAGVWVSSDSTMLIDGCTIRNNTILTGYNGVGLYVAGTSEVTIRDTIFSGNAAEQGGAGGILNESGTLDISGCLFESNVSGSGGGGIECRDGILLLRDTDFIGNSCGSHGAAVQAGGAQTVLVDGCLFSGNIGGGYGGGLHLSGSSTDRLIVDSIFAENFVTSDGAGIQFNGGGAVVRGCSFLGNLCLGRGGGIKAEGTLIDVRDCLFVDNHANDDGGGIDVTSGPEETAIVGSSFIGNHAGQIRFGEPVGGRGGGMRISAERPQIVSNLLVGNYTFDHGGGILVENAGAEGLIANLLVVGNTANWSGAGMHLANSSAPVHSCTVIDNYSGERFGGIRAGGTIHNSVIRRNRARQESQIGSDHGPVDFIACNIQDEPDSIGPDRSVDFADRFGSDSAAYTGDEDFGLTDCSFIRDIGRADLLPADTVDLDGDGDITEPLPLDLAGNPRVVGGLDLGAFELPAAGRPCTSFVDCDGNGIEDAIDIAECDGSPGCLDCNGNGRPDRCDLLPAEAVVDFGSAYWRFEDPDLPQRDVGMANLEGIIRNASISDDVPVPVIPATGLPNTASLRFDGVGRIVTDLYNAYMSFVPNSFTIEAWVRLEALATAPNAASRQYLVMKKETASSDDETEYSMLVQAGNIRQGSAVSYGKSSGFTGREIAMMFGECTRRWAVISNLEINDNDWHHVSVAVDFSGEKIRFGLDGIFEEVEIGVPGICDRIAPLYIGSRRNADDVYNQNLVGLIDELRISHGIRPTWTLLNAPPPGTSGDCNGNGLPDDCDIAAGVLTDLDGDGIPDECDGADCIGDLDGDGLVDGYDVTIVLANWLSDEPIADIDGDGLVDGLDLTIILGHWGTCD